MKYYVSVDCQESYIFPKRAALRENIITRENITILAPPTRDISSVPVNICYIRWSKWMISSKFDGADCSATITKFGNKTRSLRTKQSERKLFYYDILLSTAAYSQYAGHFFLGQFPNVEWLFLLLLLYFLLNCYIFPVGQYNSVFYRLSMRA